MSSTSEGPTTSGAQTPHEIVAPEWPTGPGPVAPSGSRSQVDSPTAGPPPIDISKTGQKRTLSTWSKFADWIAEGARHPALRIAGVLEIIFLDAAVFAHEGFNGGTELLVAEGTLALALVTYLTLLDRQSRDGR